jgi:prohibitin 1
MAAQIFNRLGQLGLGVAIAGGVANSALFNVDGGFRAVMFDRWDFFYNLRYIIIMWVKKCLFPPSLSCPRFLHTVLAYKLVYRIL